MIRVLSPAFCHQQLQLSACLAGRENKERVRRISIHLQYSTVLYPLKKID